MATATTPASGKMDCDEILRILHHYDVSFDKEAVKAAFELDEPSSLVEWARVHLSEDTLLTVDELQQ